MAAQSVESMTSGDESQVPHFLGIGAQKSGTTWLAANLAMHPGIWMPPRKELHYFDRSTRYPSPSLLASEHPLTRMVGMEKHNRIFRRKLAWAVMDTLRSVDVRRAVWNAKYFFGHCNDQWYTSLFDTGRNKVTGEITPSYSMLCRDDVRAVHRLLPAAKIIFLVRNPVERAWSQLRFETRKKGWPVSSLTFDVVKERVNSAPYELRGNYIRTLEAWSHFYSDDQLFIGFFDDIEHNPKQILKAIFSFLKTDDSSFEYTSSAFEVVNPSPKKDIPDEVRHYLIHKYYSQIEELSNLYKGHPRSWLEDIQSYV